MYTMTKEPRLRFWQKNCGRIFGHENCKTRENIREQEGKDIKLYTLQFSTKQKVENKLKIKE